MKTVRELLAHPLIQMALVMGFVTIALAIVSKRVLTEPLRDWQLGLPAYVAMLCEGYGKTRQGSGFYRSWVGMTTVVVVAALLVVLGL